MEPLASISPALLRPAAGAGGDLGSHLQANRVLLGEVVERIDASNVLIHVAGQRVPAETSVELQPGDRFLVQVERQGDEVVLRMLPEARGRTDPALLAAVRHLLADERPLGAVLSELSSSLRGELSDRHDPLLQALLAAVEARGLVPGAGAEALHALLSADHQAWPAALAAALAETGGDGFDAALRALASELRAVFAALGVEGRALGQVEGALAAALRSLAGERVEGQLDLRLLAGRVVERLGRALAATGAQRLGTLTREAGAEILRGREGALLRALVQVPGALGGRSELARSLARAAFQALGADLRGRLAAVLVELEGGALREAAGRALAGLDLEELMNAMRRNAGEALHLSLPIPDGEAWATAHLLLLERHGPREGFQDPSQAGDERSSSFRVVLGVEFSRLGKVRADLLVRRDAIAARVRAARPETAALLRASRADLEALLGQEGRRVTLAVLDGSEQEVSVDHLAHDVRFLREHHLMDLQG